MNTKKQIKKAISKVERANANRTEAYKKRLKEKIRVNLHEKKQSKEDNQVLIDRFYSAKPQQLTQMQQALLEAAHA